MPNIDFRSVKAVSVGGRPVKAIDIDGTRIWEAKSRGYVTDGLCYWWDGIWNTGTEGTHSDSTTTWTDMVAGQSIVHGGIVNENNIEYTASTAIMAQFNISDTKNYGTVEIVTMSSAGNSAALYANGLKMQYNSGYYCGWGRAGKYNPVYYNRAKANIQRVTMSLACDGTNNYEYAQGGLYNTRAQTALVPGIKYRFAYDGGTKIPCKIYCLRIYDKVLTAEEIAANYAVDRERFK